MAPDNSSRQVEVECQFTVRVRELSRTAEDLERSIGLCAINFGASTLLSILTLAGWIVLLSHLN